MGIQEELVPPIFCRGGTVPPNFLSKVKFFSSLNVRTKRYKASALFTVDIVSCKQK